MDTDSDYGSYDSDGTIRNASSPSPTPSPQKPKTLPIPDPHNLANNMKKTRNGENLFYFIVGKPEKRLEIMEKELVMLCKASPMITKLVVSSRHHPNQEIRVPEWDTRSFKSFLSYTQTGHVKIEDPKEIHEMVRLCIKYRLPKLLEYMTSILRQLISLENCVEFYYLASVYDIEELRVAIFGLFLKLGNALVEHGTFLDLDCIVLSMLISNDDFAVLEITLFRRLIEWVKAQCKRLGYPFDRKEFFGRVAGQLFRHVRYSQMTQKDFQSEVIPSGLLTEKNIEGITKRYQTNPSYWYSLPHHVYVDRPRLFKLQLAVPLYHGAQIGFRSMVGERGITESVRFMVSHDIYLTSIGFYGPGKHGLGPPPFSTYSIRIHVEGDYSKYHSQCPSQNATVIARDMFAVDLSNPFKVQRLQPYKLTVWIDGDVTQFGVFPLPQAGVVMPDEERIVFHFGDADSDPEPILDLTGSPSSSVPVLVQPYSHAKQFKTEPRSSGVIRCIAFNLKDKMMA